MGEISPPRPVLLILAAFSRHAAAFAWTRNRIERDWGPIALESTQFPFVDTNYYEPTMGPGLLKQFFAFEQLIDPGTLPAIKRLTNAWEEEYAAESKTTGEHATIADVNTVNAVNESRPLNLDPGYITLAKLVLASTKDHAHRIYLADGIFAEVTLSYKHRAWQPHDWTFPDYRRAEYHEFFTRCREWFKERDAGRGPKDARLGSAR